jgi:hypothetical protein
MPVCVGCKSQVRNGARHCPRCGRADPTSTLSGTNLLLILLLLAAVGFALIARELQII